MNDESAPKGAHESATTASIVPDGTDLWRDQLTRIESILDRILRSLAPLAGAR